MYFESDYILCMTSHYFYRSFKNVKLAAQSLSASLNNHPLQFLRRNVGNCIEPYSCWKY